MLRQLALVAACGAMRPSPKRAISRRAILSWTPLVVAPANALYASETVDAAKASYEIADPSRAESYVPLFDACGKTLGELVTNWDAIASDGDQIRRYLGTVGITSPLFKVRGALKNVLKADAPAAFDVVAFAEVSETFLAELQLAEGSAYGAQFADFSTSVGSGGLSPSATQIAKARKDVVRAKASFDELLKLLEPVRGRR